MSTAFCPTCHRPMPPETRAGVRLTPLKARIFDVIRRAGVDGISAVDINAIVFDRRASLDTVKAHVWQINELLDETGIAIRGGGGSFRIVERRS
jgi:hypothetical protein